MCFFLRAPQRNTQKNMRIETMKKIWTQVIRSDSLTVGGHVCSTIPKRLPRIAGRFRLNQEQYSFALDGLANSRCDSAQTGGIDPFSKYMILFPLVCYNPPLNHHNSLYFFQVAPPTFRGVTRFGKIWYCTPTWDDLPS